MIQVACTHDQIKPHGNDRKGDKRPTAAMMAKLAGHVWSFDELFSAVLGE
jgi:hypothetical protein